MPNRWHSFLLLALCGCATAPKPKEALSRCVWITRWDWRTKEDIEGAIGRCADAGFKTVLFQVRGNGTALWRSSIEVWSEQFHFSDPGFDPLQVAVAAAHARHVELHAWVNVVPGWRGERPPDDERQLWRKRPEWFLTDEKGQREKPATGYAHLNPCLPEVRSYLSSLMHEIAERYDVEGIHLDYIRFPAKDERERGTGFPHDHATEEAFKRETRLDARKDAMAFEKWKTECVTKLVREIRGAVLATPRMPQLTAAVWPTPLLARDRVNQEWATWAELRHVDALFPMDYQADDGVFRSQLDECLRGSHGVPIVVGISPDKHKSAAQTLRQIDAALARPVAGFALFGYQSMFGRPGEPPGAKQAQTRDAILSLRSDPKTR